MNRAVRLASKFATYTTAAGAASLGGFFFYTRRAEFVPFSLADDPIVASATYKKLNAFGNDGLHDYYVRKVPLDQVKPELLADEGKLVEKLCGGVWGGFGYDIQRKYLARKYRGPETSTQLWDPPELLSSSYPVGTCITDHFEVVARSPTTVTIRCGDSPRNSGPRASDGIFEISAEVNRDEGVALLGVKSIFFKGDGPGEPIPQHIVVLHRLYSKLMLESATRNVCK
ncbi:hypothetical protein MKEN_01134100 [Mycena kentingensis (nom. inval.)]|nr:hypothetical protein MKEN_01134100 [Mycena kentingensis (nom. inval.)]